MLIDYGIVLQVDRHVQISKLLMHKIVIIIICICIKICFGCS